jgi:hypothetical protein
MRIMDLPGGPGEISLAMPRPLKYGLSKLTPAAFAGQMSNRRRICRLLKE